MISHFGRIAQLVERRSYKPAAPAVGTRNHCAFRRPTCGVYTCGTRPQPYAASQADTDARVEVPAVDETPSDSGESDASAHPACGAETPTIAEVGAERGSTAQGCGE